MRSRDDGLPIVDGIDVDEPFGPILLALLIAGYVGLGVVATVAGFVLWLRD